jgi:hypothetical protein
MANECKVMSGAWGYLRARRKAPDAAAVAGKARLAGETLPPCRYRPRTQGLIADFAVTRP